ncbi:MAG: sugar-binding protein [Kiritimatiellia bacterium]
MKKLTILIAFASSILSSLAADVALIDPEEPREGWGFYNGAEFPGAKGSLSVADDVAAQHRPALRLSADFTGGGKYVGMGKGAEDVAVESLSFWVKAPKGANGVTLRLIDGTDQCHQLPLRLEGSGEWQKVVFPVLRYFEKAGTSEAVDFVGRYERWGGANDSKWHQPLKSLHFILGSHVIPTKGDLLISGINVTPVAQAAGKPYTESFGGRKQLDLALSEDQMLAGKKVDWTGPAFPATEGPWNIAATVKSRLHSPDNSFCVRLHVEALEGTGKMLERFTLMDQCGEKNWKQLAKEFEFPSGTAKARFVVQYYKTHGSISLKDLVATPLARTKGEKLVERILIDGRKTVDGKKQTNGHLFYPDETLDFEIGVLTRKPIPAAERSALVSVCDYWGAEALEPVRIKLERDGREGNQLKYKGMYAVPKTAIALGKYHELHVKVAPKGFAEAREYSGFARLPKAESKKYPARAIPFQIRNWDSRIREYFELADRIGHRNIGLWGDSGWDFVEKLGDCWYTGGFAVEVERNGWANTTPEQVYQKTFDMVLKHKDDKFWFICQGNEPNEKPEKAKEKVEAYEQVYKAAHAAKPDITVVSTSVPPLECFFKEGFGKWCDVYDFHVYETYENVRQSVRKYKEMGRKYGCEKPVWCTELGLNSQGQTRYAVAKEVVKKITAFFAEGGESVSWFTIQYPDKEGKARGTGGDAHNTFDCQYCLFNPRLDAIMYYTMINNVTVKKVVDEVQHEDGVQIFLFQDKTGDSFLVAWKEGERVDRGIALPTAKDIVLTRVDGSQERMVTANDVVTLGLSGEPMMLRYKVSPARLEREGAPSRGPRAEAPTLSRTHAPAAIAIDPKQNISILKGESRKVVITGPDLKASDLTAKVPPRWTAAFAQQGTSVVMTVTMPKETEARTGRVMVQRLVQGKPCAEIVLSMPIMSPIGVEVAAESVGGSARAPGRVRPAPLEPSGAHSGGVRAEFVNNGTEPKDVSWTIELVDAWAMKGGTYKLNEKGSLTAYLTGQNEGRARLAAGAKTVATAQIADFAPQTIYRVRTTVIDEQGRKSVNERYVGGCARAVRATGTVTLDGKGDEPFWKNAPVERIGLSADEALRYGKNAPAWKGSDDLSATWKAAWDDTNLYLLVEVTDDVYHAPISGSNLWNQDGLQFLFDPMRTSAEKTGKYDYGCGITPAGPEAFCYLTAHASVSEGRAPWKLAETRLADGSRRYEVAIPWTSLAPFTPAKDANLGMSMILNEDDGNGRIGFSGWFSGPHSKDLDHVGDLVLE